MGRSTILGAVLALALLGSCTSGDDDGERADEEKTTTWVAHLDRATQLPGGVCSLLDEDTLAEAGVIGVTAFRDDKAPENSCQLWLSDDSYDRLVVAGGSSSCDEPAEYKADGEEFELAGVTADRPVEPVGKGTQAFGVCDGDVGLTVIGYPESRAPGDDETPEEYDEAFIVRNDEAGKAADVVLRALVTEIMGEELSPGEVVKVCPETRSDDRDGGQVCRELFGPPDR